MRRMICRAAWPASRPVALPGSWALHADQEQAGADARPVPDAPGGACRLQTERRDAVGDPERGQLVLGRERREVLDVQQDRGVPAVDGQAGRPHPLQQPVAVVRPGEQELRDQLAA
jgi:hypothetical protein